RAVSAPPDGLAGLGWARLEALDPSRDRAGFLRRHGRPPSPARPDEIAGGAQPSLPAPLPNTGRQPIVGRRPRGDQAARARARRGERRPASRGRVPGRADSRGSRLRIPTRAGPRPPATSPSLSPAAPYPIHRPSSVCHRKAGLPGGPAARGHSRIAEETRASLNDPARENVLDIKRR